MQQSCYTQGHCTTVKPRSLHPEPIRGWPHRQPTQCIGTIRPTTRNTAPSPSQFGCYTTGTLPVVRANDRLINATQLQRRYVPCSRHWQPQSWYADTRSQLPHTAHPCTCNGGTCHTLVSGVEYNCGTQRSTPSSPHIETRMRFLEVVFWNTGNNTPHSKVQTCIIHCCKGRVLASSPTPSPPVGTHILPGHPPSAWTNRSQ
ncbi:hypothetical protein COO60DRAFT_899252 [Scenedesmus sp. NREL 46B-D3]|nr:hypothetical protein COO60DRAFT_899252 [Scenedesmus sp. NREL 46B-D3]